MRPAFLFLTAALFCTATAAKAQQEPLSFTKLWRSHPTNNSVQLPARMLKDTPYNGRIYRAGEPSFANQCAIRLGVSLREAGVTMGQLGNPRVSWFHPRDEMFILNAQELANALSRSNIPGLGKVQKFTGDDASDFYNKMFGKKGIVFFKDYWRRSSDGGSPTGDHIDVWNGYRTSASWLMEYFSWLGYYGGYAKAREVWFWEVK